MAVQGREEREMDEIERLLAEDEEAVGMACCRFFGHHVKLT
jgi:hypothetical protein